MRSLAPVTIPLLVLCGCLQRADDPAQEAGSSRPTDYQLRDTTSYETFSSSGQYALLFQGDEFIDTVDVDFGIHVIGADSLLFLPVSKSPGSPPDEEWYAIDEHVVYHPPHPRIALRDELPYLNDGFSSPSIIEGDLYYWGIVPDDGALYAMHYDFQSGRLDSLALQEQVYGTDFRFHLDAPREVDSSILFSGQGKRHFIDPNAFVLERTADVPSGR